MKSFHFTNKVKNNLCLAVHRETRNFEREFNKVVFGTLIPQKHWKKIYRIVRVTFVLFFCPEASPEPPN